MCHLDNAEQNQNQDSAEQNQSKDSIQQCEESTSQNQDSPEQYEESTSQNRDSSERNSLPQYRHERQIFIKEDFVPIGKVLCSSHTYRPGF